LGRRGPNRSPGRGPKSNNTLRTVGANQGTTASNGRRTEVAGGSHRTYSHPVRGGSTRQRLFDREVEKSLPLFLGLERELRWQGKDSWEGREKFFRNCINDNSFLRFPLVEAFLHEPSRVVLISTASKHVIGSPSLQVFTIFTHKWSSNSKAVNDSLGF
jgi:hypothetical protein